MSNWSKKVKDKKIYIAGHRGLVGSAIHRTLQKEGYSKLLTRTRKELDLTNGRDVAFFFKSNRPDIVILAAAKVGGIEANRSHPYDFIHDNLQIQTNVIHNAHNYGVERLIFLGSSCIYPKEAAQPLKEEYLLTGSLEITNQSYAVAKIAGIELIRSLREQHNHAFISLMPTNLYGIGDNYHPQHSHVLPALIRKAHQAKLDKKHAMVVWGSGKPRREFLLSDDLANAIQFLLESKETEFRHHELLNIGSGKDYTIAETAKIVAKVVGYTGGIEYQSTMPDGTMRKLLDCTKISEMGWRPQISFDQGIKIAYQDYLSNIN